MFAFGGGPDPDPLRTNIQSRYIDREQSVHSPSNQNFSGIRDAAIDRAFDRAGHTFRHKERLLSYSIVQRRLNQGAYWVPLYFTPNITTTTGRVANYRATVIFGSSLWNAYAWKVRK